MSYVLLPQALDGAKMDTRQLTDGSDTVDRQVAVIGDPTNVSRLLLIDGEGGILTRNKPAVLSAVTANLTNVNNSIKVPCNDICNLNVALLSGTFAGHNATFEVSLNSTNGTDGNWHTVQAVRSNANTIETTSGALSAAPAYYWEVSVNGCTWFRARLNAVTSGTSAWLAIGSPFATDNVPAVATHAVTGSGNFSAVPTANTGGAHASTTHHLISAATTNATSVKSSAGVVNEIIVSNDGATKAFFKLYNKASAPTVGTDTPVATVLIPAWQTIPIPMGPLGLRLTSGIAYALTGAITVADQTAVSASQLSVHMSYA